MKQRQHNAKANVRHCDGRPKGNVPCSITIINDRIMTIIKDRLIYCRTNSKKGREGTKGIRNKVNNSEQRIKEGRGQTILKELSLSIFVYVQLKR